MKTSTRNIFIAIAAVAGGFLLYSHFHKQQLDATTGASERPSSPAFPSAPARDAAAEITAEPPTQTVAAGVDYAAEFRRATNYHAFIRSALPAAQAGNPDAAYYLAAALTFCDDTHRFFFQRKEKVLSVDEAIAERARLPGVSMTGDIQRAFSRCHEVYEARDPAWGTAAAWMARAADGGQPVAQVRTAIAALLDINKVGAAEARRLGKPDEVINVDDARELTRIAVASRDPEALFQASDLVYMLRPDLGLEEASKEGMVWKYAACLRGADCSKDSEWMFYACTYDPGCALGEDGLDYLRNVAAQMHVFDIETRANAVLAKIDENAWKELGLGNL